MQWYTGNITEAISLCKSQNSLFIVLVEAAAEDESAGSVWNDPEVQKLFADNNQYVALKLKSDSELAKQFTQIYPVFIHPTLYFIGRHGQPLEVKVGPLNATNLAQSARRAFDLHDVSLHPMTAPTTSSTTSTSTVLPSMSTATNTSNQPSSTDATTTNSNTATAAVTATTTVTSSSTTTSTKAVESTSSPVGTILVDEAVGGNESSSLEGKKDEHLTLEEKTEKTKLLIAEKQAAKAKLEAEKERQKELERRKLGQDLNKLKDLKSEMERKELEKELKGRKEADRLAREQIRRQLQLDREDRARKYYNEKEEETNQQIQKENEKTAAEKEKLERERVAKLTVARIQFRFPDGSSKVQQFNSSELLSVAHSFALQSMPGSVKNVSLSTIHPRKLFQAEDYDQTFLHHNLAPSAVLVVLPTTSASSFVSSSSSQRTTAVAGSGSGNFIYHVWIQIVSFLQYLLSFLLPFSSSSTTTTTTPVVVDGGGGGSSTHTAHHPPTTVHSEPLSSSSSSPVAYGGARPKTTNTDGLKKRKEGNIHRLTAADEEDDEQATWNGNSTQQM
ncbi:hypothetical protein HELRODRAFT_189774 [Helobdella robusta]|uniref:UBX domain-containing protein 4 n=1 Tax=Helobdella robusta TaxID=6412 RepID=T1FRD2_HELRO|nr:hypothetical protein HELRODRAFT_189774 [Helobdella robusta]ESN91698.1 hypothetical protein HELRODRAFT_189774 [Helobdella robusta]